MTTLRCLLLWWTALALPCARGDAPFDAVRPLVARFCADCHSPEKQKGDLDLARFASLDAVRREPKVWQGVLEQLEAGEMPPKKSLQPDAAERERLVSGVRQMLDALALERAGDPGPVVLRRLSNAEYTYTVRDLTGVESLDPAREFPVDGAAGEGFMNTGSALVMSPALLQKYLDAGKAIASHAVLLPAGLRFSPSTTRRDWTEETLARIRSFYSRFTEGSGGDKVNLQGIVLETNEGGRLPLERYLRATLELRAAGGSPEFGKAAQARQLNARYLRTLWEALNRSEESLLLDAIRVKWRASAPDDAAALAQEIAAWQGALFKFNSVGHIGKAGGPRAWMEPASPFAERQEVRLKLSPATNAAEVRLFLVASGAGEASQDDLVVWERPRLVAPGRPDVPLHDTAKVVRGSAGPDVDAANLSIRAPAVIELRIPADAARAAEFVTDGFLHPSAGGEGAVQLQVMGAAPEADPGLLASAATMASGSGPWTSDHRTMAHGRPILAREGSPARARLEAALAEFRALFPAALCYPKIVPVDEVVTLTLFYREDHELGRLMLGEAEKRELDQLWEELRFISQDALTLVDAFEQLWQYATQDADPKVFEPLRQPIQERAAAFRKVMAEAEPRHVSAVVDLAERAYRRPLSSREATDLRALYTSLRAQEMSHEEAVRLMLARVFVAPQFLYKLEQAAAGPEPAPVTSWELATRLSYFLWSSLPDEALLAMAACGDLLQPDVLAAETRRMLSNPRARRLAVEFGCQWLHVHSFDSFDEKSERHFPSFGRLRAAMYEESILFFADFFQNDRSVLSLLDADHTFLNGELAAHYGIAGVEIGGWRRVDGVRKFGRGGVLTQAAVLSRQSGASRTSPILRGNWVAEVLLGDKLPRPPKDVPQLPEDEAAEELTVRQLTEKHSSDPLCASCHVRIDPYGYALESYDAIGRRREHDLGNRAIDTRAKLIDGIEIDGLEGLREYILGRRREAFVHQFCKKLLGYALGRSALLSDQPLLAEMREHLKSSGYRVSAALGTIVRSRQFREIRGRDAAAEH